MRTVSVFKKRVLGAIALNLAFVMYGEAIGTEEYHANTCGYYMCQHEKENIDTVILNNARNNQTVMFGEIHDSVIIDEPQPLEDSLYVITLLEPLKAMGYRFLVLEVHQNPPSNTHSHDMHRSLEDYRRGHIIDEQYYPHAKPGWINLMVKALDLGYTPVFLHESLPGIDRDAAMYTAIKEQIFDEDPRAKVVVYIGAAHVCQIETMGGFSGYHARRRPLGLLLEEHTQGKNYSVFLGYPEDTPAGCDLIISHFVWSTYRASLQNNRSLQ
jgi:hypothetical protein